MTHEALLQAAGYNVLDLDSEAIELDFFSDAVERSPVRALAQAEADAIVEGAPRPALDRALRALYGEVWQTAMTRGRSAEIALVEALGIEQPIVFTTGLFSTTMRALSRCRAKVERIATSGGSGRSDVDLEALGARLVGAGAGALVWLETANNAHAGWPLGIDHLAEVRTLCEAHGARLVLDATRVLNNCALLGGDPLAGARRMLALADAFTISCAKELLVPTGAIVGSRDAALVGRASANAFGHGTGLDRSSSQVALVRGAEMIAAHPEIIARRNDKTRTLAELLAQRGVPVVMPCGGHAVYVELASVKMPSLDVPQLFGLLGHLLVVGGVRAQLLPRGERPPLLRLAVPLERFDRAALDQAARGVAAFLAAIDRAPVLRAEPAQDHVAPLHRRYAVA